MTKFLRRVIIGSIILGTASKWYLKKNESKTTSSVTYIQ